MRAVYDTSKTTYVLEVEGLGLPRLIGPFDTREAAEAWGIKNIRNGEWNTAPVMNPIREESKS